MQGLVDITCFYSINKSVFKQSGSYHFIYVGVLSKHQRVNLYYCALDPDGVLKDTSFILVRAEYPYVQFVAADYKWAREGNVPSL